MNYVYHRLILSPNSFRQSYEYDDGNTTNQSPCNQITCKCEHIKTCLRVLIINAGFYLPSSFSPALKCSLKDYHGELSWRVTYPNLGELAWRVTTTKAGELSWRLDVQIMQAFELSQPSKWFWFSCILICPAAT